LLKSGFNLNITLLKLVTSDKFTNIPPYPLFILNTLQREPKSNCLFVVRLFIFHFYQIYSEYDIDSIIISGCSSHMPRQPKYRTIASKIANAIIIYHPPEQNNNPKPQLASASTQPTSRSPPSPFFCILNSSN
jgi:hypothetical protein